MSDDPGVVFTGLKYADVLGKPLTKSLYRQLPEVSNWRLIARPADALVWTATVYGKVNWCPPGCEPETLCNCDHDPCRCSPRRRRPRPHQHLLLGDRQGLAQGFVYCHMGEYDEYFMSAALFQQYEVLEAEARQLEKIPKPDPAWPNPARNELLAQRERIETRQKALTKAMAALDRAATAQINVWITDALAALPVILLRG